MRLEIRAHRSTARTTPPYSDRMAPPEAPPPSLIRRALRWALVLGAVGFAAGFFGPMMLSPESNIGPIIGILFSGPAGVIIGFVLGAVASALPIAETRKALLLAATCVVLAGITLYLSLPQPVVRGYVIDARIEACESPAKSLDAAMALWDDAVARVTWAKPAPNWKQTAIASVESDPGVVLTLRIEHKSPILRHRRPWDRNVVSAGPWLQSDELKQYYANDAGNRCAAYLARPRQRYWPAVGPDIVKPDPAAVWPPTDTLGFLQLQTLEPVPPQYQRVLPQ